MRYHITLLLAKTISFLMRLCGRRATHLPGSIAIRLCPDFLKHVGRPKTIIAVTGTNGKTTVCNLLIDALKENGYDLMSNSFGSNINAGVASALLHNCTIFGRVKKQLAVLEVDERSSLLIYPYIRPDYILCTNLLRDSIKRNAHVEFIQYIINSAMQDNAKLILNGDDILTCALGSEKQQKRFFGIARMPGDRDVPSPYAVRDITCCPVCDAKLKYEFVRYNHIGKVYCENCGFRSPDCDYLVTKIDEENGAVTVLHNGVSTDYKMVNNNIVNIYNMVAVIAVLQEFGVKPEGIQRAFEKAHVVKSRYFSESVCGKELVMQLAKGYNPIACSRVFDYIAKGDEKKAIMFNLDDRDDAKSSSEKITWMYDCDYSSLTDPSITQILVGGKRRYDQLVRLLLAGVPREKIHMTEFEVDTPSLIDLEQADKIFILYDIYTTEMGEIVHDRLKAKIIAESKKAGEKA